MPADSISILKSISSGKEYPLDDVRFTADNGELLDVIHDFDAIKSRHKISKEYFFKKKSVINDQPAGGVWHFKELVLPDIHNDYVVSKQEGNTRLYRSKKISAWLGLKYDKFAFSVSVNGEVFPCCAWNKPIGNIKEKTFSAIWESAEAKEIRKKIRAKQCPMCHHHTRTFDYIIYSPFLIKNPLKLLKGYRKLASF